jgi:hypothetical protein
MPSATLAPAAFTRDELSTVDRRLPHGTSIGQSIIAIACPFESATA